MLSLRLPTPDGKTEEYIPETSHHEYRYGRIRLNRTAYAAVHVVPDPFADISPWNETVIDFNATIEYRRYIWSMGLGVAEAMDTAQRGSGLDWTNCKTLIRETINASKDFPDALLANGCGTDHLIYDNSTSLDAIIAAYFDQIEFVEESGGRVVLMASRALAAIAESPDDYRYVYETILTQTQEPVILHWLGEMFDPALSGYWGSHDINEAMQVLLSLIIDYRDKIDGIKLSLLDKQKEIEMREKLPKNVRMYTGDDFNFPDLIAGDGMLHSDALLGAFDFLAPCTSAALAELASGNREEFYRILNPTIPLSRHIFSAPTQYYKTGVVFMAYLNGHQDHFCMVNGQQSARSLLHFSEIFRLADKADAFIDIEVSIERMKRFLNLNGVIQKIAG